jgi:hypothetical protein
MLGLSLSGAQDLPTQYHINCSGPAFTDAQGVQWSEDVNYTSGETYTGNEIFTAGDAPQLYQDVRWNDPRLTDPLKYSFPVAPGTYTVSLHFAEIWSGAYTQGGRVFNVNINGVPVLENLDVFAEVGSMTPLVKSFEVPAPDGKIDIDFTNVVQNAAIAGIEIVPSTGSATRRVQGLAGRESATFRFAHASLTGSLSVDAPSGNGSVHLLDLQGKRVAARSVRQAGKVVFEGLRPGLYLAAPGR